MKTLRFILLILSLAPAFMRHPKKTFRNVRRAIKNHKPAWYYFSLPKSYRKQIGEGRAIRVMRKYRFKQRGR